MKLHALALATAAALALSTAHADTISPTGTIALTDPTFNRPLTLTSLSGVGTAAHYDAFSFSGISPGSYTFTLVSNGPIPAALNTFLVLYAGGFNPANPLTNLVELNDDAFPPSGNLIASSFVFALHATTLYAVVSTSFNNSDLGNYATTITSAVPESESYALFAIGLIGLTFWMRNRNQQL